MNESRYLKLNVKGSDQLRPLKTLTFQKIMQQIQTMRDWMIEYLDKQMIFFAF
jgi:hypothetical protein